MCGSDHTERVSPVEVQRYLETEESKTCGIENCAGRLQRVYSVFTFNMGKGVIEKLSEKEDD